ncbi:MAG: hypothetical protein LBM71_03180 [Elusimicrobiota bacterium]|jgi:hypothetical protein|nr:hypothetical protein [Elusimicrobiota bacterium]
MAQKTKNPQIIEPEVIINGEPMLTPREESSKQDASRHKIPTAAFALHGILGGVLTIILGILMFLLFIFVAILAAIPMLIMSLFGKKPNIKIFKYRI